MVFHIILSVLIFVVGVGLVCALGSAITAQMERHVYRPGDDSLFASIVNSVWLMFCYFGCMAAFVGTIAGVVFLLI